MRRIVILIPFDLRLPVVVCINMWPGLSCSIARALFIVSVVARGALP